MGWVLYHVKRFWMIRVSGLHFIPHLRSPWLTGELTRPANVRLENESQSGPQVDRHKFLKDWLCLSRPTISIILLRRYNAFKERRCISRFDMSLRRRTGSGQNRFATKTS